MYEYILKQLPWCTWEAMHPHFNALQTKILKKASILLAEEKEQKENEREQMLSERAPPINLSGMSIQDLQVAIFLVFCQISFDNVLSYMMMLCLQNLCKDLHQKIDVVDEERYDIQSKVGKHDKEVLFFLL